MCINYAAKTFIKNVRSQKKKILIHYRNSSHVLSHWNKMKRTLFYSFTLLNKVRTVEVCHSATWDPYFRDVKHSCLHIHEVLV